MRHVRLIFLPLVVFSLVACGRAPLHHQESFVFGTRVEILIAGSDAGRARPVVKTILSEFDRLFRTYHAAKSSEPSALNSATAAGGKRSVTSEAASPLTDAQRLSVQCDAHFDSAVGERVGMWGGPSDESSARLSVPAALANLQADGNRMSSRKTKVAIDPGNQLNGIALDRAAAILQAHGFNNALINIGGAVMALGTKNGEHWRVGIKHPRQAGPQATIDLYDGEAIGTSGDYQRNFEFNGERYCHLLDPLSGEPVMHTQELTVLVTPRPGAGTLSDAVSKPLFIVGAEWPALAKELDIDHVLRVDAEGRMQVSEKLYHRLKFVGEPPKSLELVP
jgi:thiamine biosynthesis lipoprotein